MDRRSLTSATNGRKGGRKKGPATIIAEKMRDEIAKQIKAEAPVLIAAQLQRAKEGDTIAFRELMDRAFGRPKQPLANDEENPLLPFPIIEPPKHVLLDNRNEKNNGDAPQD